MSLLSRTVQFGYIVFLSWFLSVPIAFANNNFVPIRFPKGVTLELPGNWKTLSNNQLVTLDSYVQTLAEKGGYFEITSALAFAAHYYDDAGKTAGIVNIRYYPEETITQADARAANSADVRELDAALRKSCSRGIEMVGGRILTWLGTTKHVINGTVVFVSEYRRPSSQGSGIFRVRLVRVFNGNSSFTLTVSYRQDQEYFLKPICDQIINLLRI